MKVIEDKRETQGTDVAMALGLTRVWGLSLGPWPTAAASTDATHSRGVESGEMITEAQKHGDASIQMQLQHRCAHLSFS
jgi:hypothetical protein